MRELVRRRVLRDGCPPGPQSRVASQFCHKRCRLPIAERGIVNRRRVRAQGSMRVHRDLPYSNQHRNRVPVPDRDRKLPTGEVGWDEYKKGEKKGSTHVRILLDLVSFSWIPTGK